MSLPFSHLKTAYFRRKENSQCELNFKLRCMISDLGEINEDINAVRKESDTVASLLQHIKNKLYKIIQDKFSISSEESNKYDIPVVLKRGTNIIKDDSVLKQLIKPGVVVIFEIFDQIYHVVGNAPMVKIMELPVVLFANFSCQPCKFYCINSEKNDCEFYWYKSADKTKWDKVGAGYIYHINAADIGFYLKLVCIPYSKTGLKGPAAEVVSESIVEPIVDLPICPFEKRHKDTVDSLKLPQLRIVSYNILSERYTSDIEYCSKKSLAMDYRKQLILRELIGYHADIMCLQEVDSRHYYSYFKNELKDYGYYTIYNKKGNRIPEGLAFIYNKNKFNQVLSEHIVISEVVQKWKKFRYIAEMLENNKEVSDLFYQQATSLQVTVLTARRLKNVHLIIANTHLYYHPDATHIRLLQINVITNYVNQRKNAIEMDGSKAYVIFCGDYNSNPDSAIFEYMTNGKVDKEHENCLQISGSGCDLFHHFKLTSACGTPKYTNYTNTFKGCLDYIFTESDKFSILKTIPLPTEEELANYEGLPNDVYPSDHLALVVDLKIN